MALLDILCYPDPRLYTVAKPVKEITEQTTKLIDDMIETMYEANGIGLAATQVNVHQRIIVIDVSDERSSPIVLINPQIKWLHEQRIKGDEGCLSVPNTYDMVERSIEVKISAMDRDGSVRDIHAKDLFAVCIQHEMDHLEGKVFVDYLSTLKRNRIKTRLLKQTRDQKK
jgi:peptide deformylase